MKIRVHELAEKYSKSNKEIKDALESIGVIAKSHLTPLDTKVIEKLDSIFFEKVERKPRRAILRKKSVEIKEEPINEEKAKDLEDKNSVNNVEVEKLVVENIDSPNPIKKEVETQRTSSATSNVKYKSESNSNISKNENKTKSNDSVNELKKIVKTFASSDSSTPDSKVGKRKKVETKRKDKFAKKSIETISNSRKKNKKRKQEELQKEQEAIKSAIFEERIIKCKREVTVQDLASKIGVNPVEIVKYLFLQGKIYNMNSFMPFEIIEEVASQYNVIIEPEEEIEKYKNVKISSEGNDSRPPIVVVMGHVDHGKTSILDYIRKSKVVSGEAGGITQKIGAYQIEKDGKKITFIDTPGHEAFMDMRARGATLTDIAILVVAADDGVMPQTIEAISHARFAKIPIIVAINKIDKQESNVDKVKQELSEHGVISSEWGGDEEFIEVSALTGKNMNELLDLIMLQADVMELKADAKADARAVILESKLDKSSGPLADVIIQNGTLRVGDIFLADSSMGKVRYMVNDEGKRVKEAGLSYPVQIAGLSSVPEAGDIIEVFKKDKEAKKIAAQRALENQKNKDNSVHNLGEKSDKEFRVIIKAGSKGALAAVKNSILKIENEEIKLVIIQSSTGGITSGDLKLAKASNAVISAFEVPIDNKIKQEAEVLGVKVTSYSIIYKLIEDIEEQILGSMAPKFKEVKIGTIDVQKVFKIPKIGNIAGCLVTDGYITRQSFVKLFRNGEFIHQGKVTSLKRLKDDISRSDKNQECGIGIEKFNDIEPGDVIESYIEEQI